jgi:hypothetical protein
MLNFQAEGIFRINPENDQEQLVRDQLNRGIVPEDIDVHCLASLIKVKFVILFASGMLSTVQLDCCWPVLLKIRTEFRCSWIGQAWFRELPEGVLDGLSPEQVLQCNSENEFLELVTLLRPTQAALLK